jgi:hypothetical protein
MKGIRLTDHQVSVIKQAFKDCFQEGDHLWLFGSRADLSKRGGDIDLYVETTQKDITKIVKMRSNFITTLWRIIGEQKIDVVIKYDDTELLIYKIAREEGIQLV